MSAPLLEVTGLTLGYDRTLAVHGIDLLVPAGSVVCLIGANGAGKSTTLRGLSGLLPARAGTIRFDGADITRLPAHRIAAAGIVQVPEGRQLFAGMTVAENLRMGAFTVADPGARRRRPLRSPGKDIGKVCFCTRRLFIRIFLVSDPDRTAEFVIGRHSILLAFLLAQPFAKCMPVRPANIHGRVIIRLGKRRLHPRPPGRIAKSLIVLHPRLPLAHQHSSYHLAASVPLVNRHRHKFHPQTISKYRLATLRSRRCLIGRSWSVRAIQFRIGFGCGNSEHKEQKGKQGDDRFHTH